MEPGTSAQWAWLLLYWAAWFAAAAYLILRPEVVGQATGLLLIRYVNRPSPAWTMRFVGCGMLAYLPGNIVANLTHVWWVGVLSGLALAVVIYWLVSRARPIRNEVEW
jgi:high-affinity Fe2+/Pb2+ permease